MNTINNPLILKTNDELIGYYTNKPDFDHTGSYIDKDLSIEMLEALEDYRDFLITGVSGISLEEICKLILKAKG